jgi:tRNA (guanine-N7-)-methyltransferase
MKPKSLKSPLTWEQRRPLISDRILFVPEYYDRHHEWSFPGWEHPDIFGRSAPIEVEYCSGNGLWIIEKALAYPERNWVAVERQFERVRKIWSKMHNFSLTNLFIVCGEALTFTRFYVPERSFAAVYINFPDPWPKAKHAKNRLLQEPFITEIARTAAIRAKMTIVTDHFNYTEQISQTVLANPLWHSCFPEPYFVNVWENYGSSYFDALWRERGLVIYYMQYLKEKERNEQSSHFHS